MLFYKRGLNAYTIKIWKEIPKMPASTRSFWRSRLHGEELSLNMQVGFTEVTTGKMKSLFSTT
jgi:hypothetical protein